MKISELISALQKRFDTYGDIEVSIEANGGFTSYGIHSVYYDVMLKIL